MHRLILAGVVFALAAATATGQTAALNAFGVYPDATTFTSRSGVPGSSGGDIVMMVENRLARGIGQVEVNRGQVNGFRITIQDQNAQTRENFTLAVLRDSAGKPVPTGPEFLRTAPSQTPSGTGTQAWTISATLGTPAKVLPKFGNYHYGIGLPSNSSWSNDGLSVHTASFTIGSSGDNPRSNAPNPTHSINRPANTVNPQPSGRVHRIFILTEGPVLNVGASIVAAARRGPDPSFGHVGHYPDSARSGGGDGFALRLLAAGKGGGAFSVTTAIDSTVGFPLNAINGCYFLGAAGITLVGGSIPSNGTVVISVPPPLGKTGVLHFQGATLFSGSVNVTNMDTRHQP